MTATETFTFRAIWPVVDPSVPPHRLIAEARADLPRLARQAHARVARDGRFSLSPAALVPGSGNATTTVLVYEAPAERKPARVYHRQPTAEGVA